MKRRAFPWRTRALHPNTPSHRLYQTAGDIQPHPGSANGTGDVASQPYEALEELLSLRRWHAQPLILDTDLDGKTLSGSTAACRAALGLMCQ